MDSLDEAGAGHPVMWNHQAVKVLLANFHFHFIFMISGDFILFFAFIF